MEGSGLANVLVTPYFDRFPEYRQTALEAFDHVALPIGLEEIVRDYFTSLEP